MSDEQEFLSKISQYFYDCAANIRVIENSDDRDSCERILHLLKDAVDMEIELRAKHNIADRFKVIQAQIRAIFDKAQKVQKLQKQVDDKSGSDKKIFFVDHAMVFVYLFNVQGSVLRTWQSLLTARALSDHCVNRPIYSECSDIEKLLKILGEPTGSRGYLEIIVKKNDIIKNSDGTLVDKNGIQLLKLRQGAMLVENIQKFCHKNKCYQVNDDGVLVIT